MSDVTGGSLIVGSSAQNAGTVFNLHDEKNALSLLKKIHNSPISSDEKNELRDVVFVFRNNPSSEVTLEFIEKFSELGFTLGGTAQETPVTATKIDASVPVPLSRFGTTRLSPVFSNMAAKPAMTKVVDTPKVGPDIVESVTQEVLTPAPKDTLTDTEKVVKPIGTSAEPEPVSVPGTVPPVVADNKVPAEQIAEQVLPRTEVVIKLPVETVVAPEPVSVPVTPAIPPAPTLATGGAVLERIKEIKKEVNLLVGNPVNLIDVHNDVGREYMNSLLDAMKKNNGGTADQVGRAMQRLETAFVAVKETVGAAGVVQEKVAEPEVSEVSTEPSSEVVPEALITPEVPPAPVEAEVEDGETSTSTSGYASVQQKVEKVVDIPEAVIATPESELIVPEKPTVPTQVASVASVEIPAQQPEITTPAKPAESLEPQSAGGIMSVAKEKQIQDLMTAQKQEAATTDRQKQDAEIASMDPLMTPAVTNGLQQLLSEWALFKSSGIFGTGSSGMEHPLYKQLSILNMTAIVAGRYEGATPQIKRSITDYMNGWRYEEGILQEQGELFEHYLRRVIKHILDKRVQ